MTIELDFIHYLITVLLSKNTTFEDLLSLISKRLVQCDGHNRSSFIILNYVILPDDGSKKYFNTRNNTMEEVQYLCQYNILLLQTLRLNSMPFPSTTTTTTTTTTD